MLRKGGQVAASKGGGMGPREQAGGEDGQKATADLPPGWQSGWRALLPAARHPPPAPLPPLSAAASSHAGRQGNSAKHCGRAFCPGAAQQLCQWSAVVVATAAHQGCASRRQLRQRLLQRHRLLHAALGLLQTGEGHAQHAEGRSGPRQALLDATTVGGLPVGCASRHGSPLQT